MSEGYLRSGLGLRRAWLKALACLGFCLAWAPLCKASVLTLDDAVRIALSHNHQISIAKLDSTVAEERASALNAEFFPRLGITGAGLYELTEDRYTLGQPVTGDIGVGSPPILDIPVSVSGAAVTLPREFRGIVTATVEQPITQLYELSIGHDIANIEREVMLVRIRSAVRKVESEVKRAYYNVLRVTAALVSVDATVDAVRGIRRTMRNQYQAGTVLQTVALRADAQLAEAEYRQSRFRNLLQTAEETLNLLMGRRLNEPLLLDSKLPAPRTSRMTLAEAKALAAAHRADAAEAALRVQQADRDVDLKWAAYIPEVTLFASYSRNLNIPFLPEDAGRLELVLEWDVFEWGKKAHEKGIARAVLGRIREEATALSSEIELEVARAYRELSDARRLLTVKTLRLDVAREHVRVIRERYERQRELPANLLVAVADLVRAQEAYQEALLGFWQAESSFEIALGVGE